MVSAIAYSLDNKFKFKIFSVPANFAPKNGWTEFFLPFCDENNDHFNFKYNHRSCQKNSLFFKARLFWRNYFKKQFFTWQFFEKLVPGMYINDKPELYKNICDMIWRFNENTQNDINEKIAGLNLPENYISLQIRRGDKWELERVETPELDLYIEQIQELNKGRQLEIKDLFVFCDDYRDYSYLVNKYPDYNFYTLTQTTEKGYFNKQFTKLDWNIKRDNLIKLFANIEIIRKSEYFIGTYWANPLYFLQKIMGNDKVFRLESLIEKQKESV